MNVLILLAGLALVGVAIVDVLTTTVSPGSGAGPLTARISRGMWGMGRKVLGDRHAGLRRVGVGVLLMSILTWLLLIWFGWTLVLASAGPAVVDTASGAPATFEQRIYYAGYTILTLGIGDYRPDGAVWRLATILAAANGFAVLTLAITYLVPVLSAATEARQLAAHLHALGPSPRQLILAGWDGEGFDWLAHELSRLGPQLLLHEQRHDTYPVLHYFHSGEPATAAPLRFAALAEALVIMEHGIAPEAGSRDRRLELLRRILGSYLDTVTASYVAPADHPPPPADLDPLREAGIPTVDDDAFALAMEDIADLRRRLLGLLQHDAWRWGDMSR